MTLPQHALNAVCPYYTMYPLEFPLRILTASGQHDEWVLDPFCGRGTTNFAARLCGMPSCGFDTSPVATAIAAAKLANSSQGEVIATAKEILSASHSCDVPESEFWTYCYNPSTLHQICQLRESFIKSCHTDAEIVLRAIVMGALHGPLTKSASYLSNQCPRTFAPKPGYAVRFWRARRLHPPDVSVLDVIARRAASCLREALPRARGYIRQQDSRQLRSGQARFSWIITSPPYYGMRTYLPDQWLRYWFVGGEPFVTYGQRMEDFEHTNEVLFASQLHAVWLRAARLARPHARLVCRFGGIRDRRADPLKIIKDSLRDSGWRVATIRQAGDACSGKRQATQFGRRIRAAPRPEYDVYALRA